MLFYGYSTGVFSSRKIEQATHDSVAFRFIARNLHPDHDTIANFRKKFLHELKGWFKDILMIGHELGLVKLGNVFIDGTKETPYLTSDITNPINVYGESKLAGQKHIQESLKEHFIVRTSWLYSEFGKSFYKIILEKSKTETALQITDEQTGCPTNASDLAVFILNLAINNSKAYGIHHFTDDEAMTWYDFANKIIKENNLQEKVRLDKAKNYRTFAKRPKNSVLKQTKLRF